MIAALLLGSLGCKADPPRPQPIPPAVVSTADTGTALCADAPTWDTFASGYIRTWCTPCHTEVLGAGERQGAPLGVDFDRWSQVVAWESRILARATGPEPDMPPLGGVSVESTERLVEWFACGAVGSDPLPATCDTLTTVDVSTIDDEGDAAALCAQGNATRGLTIRGEVTIDCLCEVDGDLIVEGSATLPALRAVRGDLQVEAAQVHLPALNEVAGDVEIVDSRVEEVSLGALLAVGGDLHVGPTQLTILRLPLLGRVDGELTVLASQALGSIDLPRLHSVGGAMRMEGLPALVDLDSMGSLDTVGGDLTLIGVALPALDHFRLLTSVSGAIVLTDLPALTALDGFTILPAATSVLIARSPSVQSVEGFDNLVTLDELTIQDNPALQSVLGFVNLDRVGRVTVDGNYAVRSLAGLDALHSVGDLHLSGVPVPELPWFGQLTTVDGTLTLDALPQLRRISGFGALATVGGDLTLSNLPRLELAVASQLVSVGGSLTLIALPAVSRVPFLEQVESIGGGLTLEQTGLADVHDLAVLGSVGGDLRIVDNPNLPIEDANAFADRLIIGGATLVW